MQRTAGPTGGLLTLGKYEIRRTLGKGAMGTVYEGWDPLISRRVAIKTVRLPDAANEDAQQELARFRREAQAAGRLTHPNLVGIYDYGESAGMAYIVMEFVDGKTLEALLNAEKYLALPLVRRVMGDVLAGLEFSHSNGVIHRDIKPANVMLTSDGRAKIADFGIARIESSSMTQTGMVLGTPAYMSPEQAFGEPVDLRTDIYSSGVLLYHLLTGKKPFEGSLTVIMQKVATTTPLRPSALSVAVPAELDAVVARAMARNPEERYLTATAFAQAITAALDAPTPALAQRPERRGAPLVPIAAGAAVALALASGAAWWLMASPAIVVPLAAAPTVAGDSLTSMSAAQVIGLLAADAEIPALSRLLDKALALTDSTRGQSTYRHALENALLPRLLRLLETQLRGNLNRPDILYEATRVYLMLGGSGPLDRDVVRKWMQFDWEADYPGATNAPLRASLARHLDALLAEPMPQVSLDNGLVAQARETFSRISLAQRIYSRIKLSAAALSVQPWRPSDALGAAGAQVFIRISGKPLTDGIPGFLTMEGFQQVLLPALTNPAQDMMPESWVLGQQIEFAPNSPEMGVLEREIAALYVAEYTQAWDAMLADLDVTPLRSLVAAVQDLFILASPQHSPMRTLLANIARQVGFAGAATQPSSAVRRFNEGLDEHFSALRAVVGVGTGAAPGGEVPIDQVLKLLANLQQSLAKLVASARTNQPAPAANEDPALAVRAEALRQPQPLGRWLTAIAASGTALRTGDPRKQIVAAWNTGGGPASQCPIVVARYPFAPNAAGEVSLEEFARLFAPGGAMDGFFNTQLRPYVDTSGGQWKPKEVAGVNPPVTQAELLQFQRAATIRDRFFAGGSGTPLVRFDITPATADAGTQQALLDLGDVLVAYEKGTPPRQTQVAWPGSSGRMQQVGISWSPPPVREAASRQETGPWALFRLFAQAPVTTTGDKAVAQFSSGERRASFELRAGAAPNAFTPDLLREFRCPTVR